MSYLSWELFKNAEQDIGNLLKEFEKTNSLRFSDFCNVWKDAKFSLIFCGRNNPAELREFIEELFLRTKKFLLPVHEHAIRIGALYALYGLYFKQPLKKPVKIRFIKSEWVELCKLMDMCKEQNHHDVVFIHLKLFSSEAYLFTATVRDVGFEYGFRKYFRKENIIRSGSSSYNDLVKKPLIEPSLLDNLSKLVSSYCQLKAETIHKKNPELVNSDFVSTLQRLCQPNEKSSQVTRKQIDTPEQIDQNDLEDLDDSANDPDYVDDEPSKKAIGRKRRHLKIQAHSGRKKESAINSGRFNSGPPRKKRRITKQAMKTKKTAKFLLEQRKLDNAGPSTSNVPFDVLSLPQL